MAKVPHMTGCCGQARSTADTTCRTANLKEYRGASRFVRLANHKKTFGFEQYLESTLLEHLSIPMSIGIVRVANNTQRRFGV